ncbi:MAG TPA: GNAT family N-acetyltransferase [Conexibacter sp.]|jgi:RimJ/RimL family protein N-acetyltransferase
MGRGGSARPHRVASLWRGRGEFTGGDDRAPAPADPLAAATRAAVDRRKPGAADDLAAAPLLTPRLELRPWRDDEADRDAYALLCSDPEVMRHVGAGVALTRPQANEQMTRFIEHWTRHGFGLRAAVLRESGEMVGFVGVARAGEPGVRPGDVEIGWRLARAHWGNGYATEGGRAVRDHAFAELRLARLVAFVRPANTASIAVARKLAMEPLRDGHCRRGLPLRTFALDNPLAGSASAAQGASGASAEHACGARAIDPAGTGTPADDARPDASAAPSPSRATPAAASRRAR